VHICLVIDAKLPVQGYGGTERVVYWLGRALYDAGHKVTFLAQQSKLDFADVIVIDKNKRLEDQLPESVDIVHLHSGFDMPVDIPACQTIHGNCREVTIFHPNSIFVSNSHAENHGARAFVYNGLDARDYGEVEFNIARNSYVFLAKAAWRVKNVKGAIRVAELANSSIDVLGGHRLNFKMGFRLTLSANAHFHGMVDDSLKIPYLRQARGLIFPVLWPEPFGVAVIESLYFGTPVFATPYGSLTEIVNQDVGFLSNSAFELATAARQWASFDRRVIHEYWERNFSAKVMAKKYITYYTSILDGQNLHAAPIVANPVRASQMMPWTM
jgi:glycosyltransferase involved in cell wall biosynthesis